MLKLCNLSCFRVVIHPLYNKIYANIVSLNALQVVVDRPEGNEPVGLDMQFMGKGQAWLNGKAIGRYWPRTSSIHDECAPSCNYRGKFFPDKCRTGCGEPTQRW